MKFLRKSAPLALLLFLAPSVFFAACDPVMLDRTDTADSEQQSSEKIDSDGQTPSDETDPTYPDDTNRPTGSGGTEDPDDSNGTEPDGTKNSDDTNGTDPDGKENSDDTNGTEPDGTEDPDTPVTPQTPENPSDVPQKPDKEEPTEPTGGEDDPFLLEGFGSYTFERNEAIHFLFTPQITREYRICFDGEYAISYSINGVDEERETDELTLSLTAGEPFTFTVYADIVSFTLYPVGNGKKDDPFYISAGGNYTVNADEGEVIYFAVYGAERVLVTAETASLRVKDGSSDTWTAPTDGKLEFVSEPSENGVILICFTAPYRVFCDFTVALFSD